MAPPPFFSNNNARLAAGGQLFAQANTRAQNAPEQRPTKPKAEPVKPNNRYLEKGLLKGFVGASVLGSGVLAEFSGVVLLSSPEPVLTKIGGVALFVGGSTALSKGILEIVDAAHELSNAYNEAFPKK